MLLRNQILYEDNHLLAVVKKAGDLTQGDRTGDVPLLDRAKAYLKEKYQKPGEVFLGLVHRLDRPVSGVILFARTSKAAARLSDQFRERTVEKIYQAVVEGVLPRSEERLVHFLTGGEHRTRVTASVTPKDRAKRAELSYQVLASDSSRSLVRVRLITGYKHQIRVQLAAVGCPVVGDFKYDKRQKPAQVQPLAEGRAIALHATRLTVLHPTKQTSLTFEAPLPAYWPTP